MRFNPSNNQQTNQIFNLIVGLAGEEYRLQRKKQAAAEMLKDLQGSGLFGMPEGQYPIRVSSGFPRGGKRRLPELQQPLGGLLDGSSYISGIDLETGMPEVSFMSPKDQQEMSLMSEVSGNPRYRRKSVSVGGQTYERVPTDPEFEEEASRKATADAMAAAEKEKITNATKVGRLSNIIDLIETKYAETKTPSGRSGFIRRPMETFSRGLQMTENQRIDKAYADFRTGARAQLARAMGEVGNLSESEQKAAMDLVPDLLDDPRTAAKKIQNLRDFVKQIQEAAAKPTTSFLKAPGSKATKSGGQLMQDANGNRALVYPDGSFEEVE